MQKKLKAWRRYFGITQERMAEWLGIDVRTYIKKEQGESQFKANEMFAVAEILQKDISEVFLPTNFMNHEERMGNTEQGTLPVTERKDVI